MNTLETIQKILEENLSIPKEEVTLDSTFESLKIDSLDMIELIYSFEDETGLELGQPENINTIGELITYIDGLK